MEILLVQPVLSAYISKLYSLVFLILIFDDNKYRFSEDNTNIFPIAYGWFGLN